LTKRQLGEAVWKLFFLITPQTLSVKKGRLRGADGEGGACLVRHCVAKKTGGFPEANKDGETLENSMKENLSSTKKTYYYGKKISNDRGTQEDIHF